MHKGWNKYYKESFPFLSFRKWKQNLKITKSEKHGGGGKEESIKKIRTNTLIHLYKINENIKWRLMWISTFKA